LRKSSTFSGCRRLRTKIRAPAHSPEREVPDDQEARLYFTFFCRNCGQEHHPVVLAKEGGVDCVLPRDIDDTPLDDPDSAERPGYLMPEPENDAEFSFKGDLDDFPEDWLDVDRGGAPRLRRDRKSYVPEPISVECRRRDGLNRPACLVHSRTILLLPRLQGSADGARTRDQQARRALR
jgi:hypothetical protein